MTTNAAKTIRVEVVYALPDRYWSVHVRIAEGSCAADALAAASIDQKDDRIEINPAQLAVFSRPVAPSTILRDGDRLEILRPLVADPKQSRRTRALDAKPKKKR